eukprot:gene1928-694_t
MIRVEGELEWRAGQLEHTAAREEAAMMWAGRLTSLHETRVSIADAQADAFESCIALHVAKGWWPGNRPRRSRVEDDAFESQQDDISPVPPASDGPGAGFAYAVRRAVANAAGRACRSDPAPPPARVARSGSRLDDADGID